MRSKGKWGHWERKCENRFLLISLSKVDRPILHVLSNTFHQRKCFVFCYICLQLSGTSACHSHSGRLAVHRLVYVKCLTVCRFRLRVVEISFVILIYICCVV